MGSFLYRANGLAVGGELFAFGSSTDVARARRTAILSEGSFLLPNTGGEAAAMVKNFFYAGVSVSAAWGGAEGHPTGDYNKPTSYETSLRLEVQDVNVFDLLSIQRLVIRMSSSHPGPPTRTSDLGDGDLAIRVEYGIEGLVVAGTPVELDVTRAAAFRESLVTHAAILAEAKKQRRNVAGRTTIDTLLFDGGRALSGPARGGVVVKAGTRAVGKASYDEQSCVIVVPGLGTVYFGEVLSTKDSRRINLVRISVDRPAPWRAPLGALGPARVARVARAAKKKDDEIEKGEILIGSVEINGSTYP